MRVRRPPLPYLYIDDRDPLPFVKVEDIIRCRDFLDWEPMQIRLGQIGDGGNRRPEVFEFTCEMEGGLLALFRSDQYGIPQLFSKVPIDSHTDRHQSAFAVSHTMGVELCPMCFKRDHPSIGTGTLTAMLFGESFLFVADGPVGKRGTKGRRLRRQPTALAEAYVFDYAIGSGQRSESSYVIDNAGLVRSQYHHEAFSWTENRRLEAAFRNTNRAVSTEFWSAFTSLEDEPHKLGRVTNILEDRIGAQATDTFRTTYGRICRRRAIGDTTINVY